MEKQKKTVKEKNQKIKESFHDSIRCDRKTIKTFALQHIVKEKKIETTKQTKMHTLINTFCLDNTH